MNRFRATWWLLSSYGRAAWQYRERVQRSLTLPEGMEMDEGELRRLKHYFYGTTYLAALMCSLRNHPRSSAEKYLFDNLSALAHLFDDLVDSSSSPDDTDILWQDNPEAFGLVADERGLALYLLHNICQALPNERLAQFRAYMHRVFKVETLEKWGFEGSRVQAFEGLGVRGLEKTTEEKGGCSVLLFRSMLSHPLSKEEEHALFQFGHLIQLCDDIFDLWHDRKAGIATMATYLAERGELGILCNKFEAQVTSTQSAFCQTAYPHTQVETALHTMHFLVSVTRVCLRHYKNLEKKHGSLPLDNRTAMVVDMGLWANQIQAARFLLRPIR